MKLSKIKIFPLNFWFVRGAYITPPPNMSDIFCDTVLRCDEKDWQIPESEKTVQIKWQKFTEQCVCVCVC